MIDLTNIIVALIGLLGTIITTFLIPLIRSKLTAAQQDELQKLIQIGVAAAEQLSNTGVIKKAERKQFVIDFLASKGFTADMDLIEKMLEASVYELPGKITTNEVKKLAEVKVEAMAENVIEARVATKVDEIIAEKMYTVPPQENTEETKDKEDKAFWI